MRRRLRILCSLLHTGLLLVVLQQPSCDELRMVVLQPGCLSHVSLVLQAVVPVVLHPVLRFLLQPLLPTLLPGLLQFMRLLLLLWCGDRLLHWSGRCPKPIGARRIRGDRFGCANTGTTGIGAHRRVATGTDGGRSR